MKTKRFLFLVLALLALLMVSNLALAQSGYHLAASVIADGGGSLQAGNYRLTGTSGQPEALHQSTVGVYSLSGGFWHALQQENKVFLPRVVH